MLQLKVSGSFKLKGLIKCISKNLGEQKYPLIRLDTSEANDYAATLTGIFPFVTFNFVSTPPKFL